MKFIIIGLGAAIIIMVFVLLQANRYAGKLKVERDTLSDKANNLTTQLVQAADEKKQLMSEFDAAQKEIARLGQENEQAKQSTEALRKERQQLAQQVSELNAKIAELNKKSSETDPQRDDISTSAQADAYMASLLKKKAELELKLESMRNEVRGVKLANESLMQEKAKLELDLRSFETETKEASREYSYSKKLTDGLSAELAREKSDKFQIIETARSLKDENRFLKQQLKVIYDRKTKLEQKYAQLQDKNAVLESNLAKLEAFVREKIVQVDTLRDELGISSGNPAPYSRPEQERFSDAKKQSIELAPIVVRSPEVASARGQIAAAKNASVIAVNRDSNFVIINIGSSSGVKAGDRFQVFKGQDAVGQLEAIQVRDSISACDIKSQAAAFAVGDAVR